MHQVFFCRGGEFLSPSGFPLRGLGTSKARSVASHLPHASRELRKLEKSSVLSFLFV